MTIQELINNGDLKCFKQSAGSGARRYIYLSVQSPYLNDAHDLKEWLKTFLIEVNLTN